MHLLAAITDDPLGKKWPALVQVMLGRLVLLAAILAGVTALAPRHSVGLYAVVSLAFVIAIPYALWLERDETVRRSAPNQFIVDAIIITGLVHFTGGIKSDLHLLYPLVILVAGIVVSGRLALRVALFAVVVYATLVVLEMGGVLPYSGVEGPALPAEEVVQMLMMRILIFVFCAAASSYLADRCFYQGRQLERLQTLGQAIISNVAVPLLGVHPDGRVLLVNAPAAQMLGREPADIRDRPLAELFAGPAPELRDGQGGTGIWDMVRPDGTTFPVTFEASLTHLPAVVSDSLAVSPGDVGLFVMVLRDVTDLFAAEDRVRLRTAASMLTEMAHSVSNPLAAIKGAGEVLLSAMNATPKGERKITPADVSLIGSMIDVIHEETVSLDRKVKEFMELATSDPDKLRELTTEAESWTAKLPLSTRE